MNEAHRDHEDTWLQYLPSLHRALAAPQIAHCLPRSYVGLDFEQSCAWWETLRYLFRSMLGWRSLPAGLAWWYQAGIAGLGDPRLELVLNRWNTRGELDLFAAREWETGGATGMGDNDIGESWPAEPHEPHPGWWREFRQRQPIAGHVPYGGGWNPLHLGHSDQAGEDGPDEAPVGIHDAAARRATLVVAGFASWKRELREYGKALPDVGDRSWHVEVFERRVGYLGRFRQSRVTGLWFQGKHSIHMAGNPADAAQQ